MWASNAADHPSLTKYSLDPISPQKTSISPSPYKTERQRVKSLTTIRLTIKYAPSHTIRPTFASSPTATSHTTSPARSKCITPAFFSSTSHATTLESANQSPSGDGTNTCNSGARLGRKSGDWNPAAPPVLVLPTLSARAREDADIPCAYEWVNDDEGDGARLELRENPRYWEAGGLRIMLEPRRGLILER